MLLFKIKKFDELTNYELYELLKLRTEVFVVEQNCVYQDMDGKDYQAIHVLGYYNEILVACTRIFDKGIYFEESSIGRVIVKEKFRTKKWGHVLMQKSIEIIETLFDTTAITISAQLYLKAFYESHQFVQTSTTYLEDNIPHIQMKKN
jgi:ElaA protein